MNILQTVGTGLACLLVGTLQTFGAVGVTGGSGTSGGVTNAIGTVKTNGTLIVNGATSINFVQGSNTVLRVTNNSGAVSVEINASAASGSTVSTNLANATITNAFNELVYSPVQVGTNLTIDLARSRNIEITLTNNVHLVFSNAANGIKAGRLKIGQNSTGGFSVLSATVDGGLIRTNGNPWLYMTTNANSEDHWWFGTSQATNVWIYQEAFYLGITPEYKGTNIIVGVGIATNLTSGRFNTLIGERAAAALETTVSSVFIGYEAGRFSTNADFNTVVGTAATSGGFFSGTRNTIFGYHGGLVLTTGANNTLIGDRAGSTLTNTSENTFVGFTAGQVSRGAQNTVVGSRAGIAMTTPNDNAIFGYQAGTVLTTGDADTIIGTQAGISLTTGNNDTFLGYRSGRFVTSGYGNTYLGTEAGAQNTNGVYNVFLGMRSWATNVSHTFMAGGEGFPITNVFYGNGYVSAAPVSYTINGTGGIGTDIGGATVTIAGGNSTGTGAGGNIDFKTSTNNTSTAVTTNSSLSRMTVYGGSGMVGNHYGTYYRSNAVTFLPTATQLGVGGYWVGNSNGTLVSLYSANGSTTAMKVLAP